MHNTITLAAANRLSDHYLEVGRRTVSVDAKLVDHDKQDGMSCEDNKTGADLGTIRTQQGARMTGLDPEDPDQYYSKLRKWWAANGFHVTSNNQHTSGHSFIIAENNSDRFAMTFHYNKNGEYFLDISSPCVWRNGTPDPDKPGGG